MVQLGSDNERLDASEALNELAGLVEDLAGETIGEVFANKLDDEDDGFPIINRSKCGVVEGVEKDVESSCSRGDRNGRGGEVLVAEHIPEARAVVCQPHPFGSYTARPDQFSAHLASVRRARSTQKTVPSSDMRTTSPFSNPGQMGWVDPFSAV